MKNVLFAIALLFGAALGCSAKDIVSHDVNVLPDAARSVLKKQFDSGISLIKIDKEFAHSQEYEVILTDGTEVTFDSKGNWKNIERESHKSVPKFFVPAAVATYVKSNHGGTRIIGIEKERKGYEVTLSDGLDLKFDKEGRFVKYD